MRRNLQYILAFGLALASLGGSAPVWGQEGPGTLADAERRMAELAERYGAERPAAAAEPVGLADIEETPLGLSGPADPDGPTPASPRGGWVLSTLAALGVVIGLIFAARAAYAKLSGSPVARPSAAVEVLSRTPVAPKNQVLLLRVGQRVLVVGDSASGLRTLADLDDPEEVASLLQSVTAGGERSGTKSFNALIERFGGDYDRRAHEGGDTQEVHLDRTRDSLSGLASRLRSLGGRGGGA